MLTLYSISDIRTRKIHFQDGIVLYRALEPHVTLDKYMFTSHYITDCVVVVTAGLLRTDQTRQPRRRSARYRRCRGQSEATATETGREMGGAAP